MSGRTAMAQDGAWTAGQHRSQPVALGAQRGVPEGVDAAVQQLQAPHRQPMLHRAARHSQRQQLRA
jgi:hypothetical protein